MALKTSLGFLVLSLACASTHAQLTSMFIPEGEPGTTYTASLLASGGGSTTYQILATNLMGKSSYFLIFVTDCQLGEDSADCVIVNGPIPVVTTLALQQVPVQIVQDGVSPDSSSTTPPATSTDPTTSESTGTGPVSSTTSKSSGSTSQSQSSSASTPTKTSSGSERAVVKGASVLGSVLVGLGMAFGIAV
ncbi:uncharacterized protein BXZ73DRAFT_81128 [Epithele typhae]|uniref:uncharacterized protein n=1 Tax=Epithele typhae TaxID=378194 RepID=UPI002007C24C|nr:uncharacterized protein BXZ73DRAFT_81128 [Epithele typhae]KAH9916261.1 hypothetical protein BXZ73DRAFT_81128 [Epithele typhae]